MASLSSLANVSCHELDVCSAKSIEAIRKLVEEETGGSLDVLVNNAGISYTTPSVEMDLETTRSVFEVNLFAVMAMNAAFHNLLIRSKGTIFHTGSFLPSPLRQPLMHDRVCRWNHSQSIWWGVSFF